jgi:2-oxoglutarate ferredoxin oxidoreductase subunit gamma
MKPGSSHREIILAGTGGQGLIVAGIMLAEAAMLEGKNVAQTQSYGIASRGGLSLAEVVIDEDEIIFQQVRTPDCILALTEEAAKKYESWAAKGVPMLYDSTLAAGRNDPNFIGREFTRIASDLGNVASVNILALATVAAYSKVVRLTSLESLVRKRFRGAALDLNLKLLALGGELARAENAACSHTGA